MVVSIFTKCVCMKCAYVILHYLVAVKKKGNNYTRLILALGIFQAMKKRSSERVGEK